MTIVTTLVIPPGGDVGPFNLYSDSDGYTVPFATNVSAAALQAGYSSTVPNDATIIRVISTGLCTNFIDLNINLITTTTTSSSTSTSTSTSSTTTTTTTICPCTYINVTITEGYIAFSDTASVDVIYTNCNGVSTSTTYTAAGTYTICSSNINSIQGSYLRLGVPQIVPVFPVNSGTLCCITTTTTTTIPPCSYVLLTDSNGYVLRYILATNTVTTLFNSSVSPNDLAHSNDKLWLNTAFTIHEYDITLSPWSQTFNRNISTGSVQTGFALGKPPGINNKLVTVDVSRSPGVIVELDITNSPATSVDIATLPAGAVTPGDLLITDTAQPKILINLTSVTSGANGLYQYDYNTGAFEIYVPLGLATSAFGMYEEGNLIYLVTGPGLTYSLLPTPPYTVTYVQTIPTVNPGQVIFGGSQLSECTEVILTLPPTTTTTTTI
jgi:hypothetical protein